MQILTGGSDPQISPACGAWGPAPLYYSVTLDHTSVPAKW